MIKGWIIVSKRKRRGRIEDDFESELGIRW